MSKLAKVTPIKATVEDSDPDSGPAVGQWYWVKEDKGEEECLECVVHVGSNYVRLEDIRECSHRIHFDNFEKRCRRELDPESHIDSRIAFWKGTVDQLMGRVKELTARLGVAPSPELAAGSETRALATVNSTSNMGEYKAAMEAQSAGGQDTKDARRARARKGARAWFTSLPKAVRDAVRSQGKRSMPKGYEELLRRYFEDRN